MKKALGVASLLFCSVLAGCSHPAYAPPPPPPPGLNYQAIEDQGYRDGSEAARNDVATGRPPGFDHHPRYRRPPVPRPGFAAYRQGFRRGYEGFLRQGPAPRPGY